MPRGSKPGERRGGRQKGTPNKQTAMVKARLDALGVDPIEGLALLAQEAEQAGEKHLAMNCYRTLAEYCEPKRRAVEYTEKYAAADPEDIERQLAEAIRQEVRKLSAAELSEIIDPKTLKQLTAGNVAQFCKTAG